jgi:cytochrome P450
VNAQHDAVTIQSTMNIEPSALYDRWRGNGPVLWDPTMNGWIVLSYELCKHIEEREDLYRHPYADADDVLLEIKGGPRNLTVLQGDEHTRMHRYLVRLFSPKAVQKYMQEHVQPIVDHLFGRLSQRPRADLAAEVADQLPPRVFVSLFGMDWHDEVLVNRQLELHNTVMDWIGGLRTSAATQSALEASRELNSILLPQIRKLRVDPGTDVISELWAAAPGILEDVDDDAMLAICREIFLAGSDTTVHAIANAYYILLTKPDVRRAVSLDRGAALDNFIEESLRLYTVIPYRFRVANQDSEIGGVLVRSGELVIPVNAAANRDPERFTCPGEVDLARPQARTHLAFNWGPRTCVGAALARAELRVLVIAFLDRLPNVALDPAAAQPYFANVYTRGFRPLNVLMGQER